MSIRRNVKLSNQLLPSLLDRLTDVEPKRRQEIKQDYVFNLPQYRQAVLRDILALLNTTCLQSNDLAKPLPPHLENSVINYGIRAFSGNNFADIEWQQVEQVITHALINYEPRLEANTIQVSVIVNNEAELLNHRLIIEIKGDLKLNPYPQEFLLRTSMDIETGLFNLVEGSTHE
ncbi:type VI secretion system baseplate subunit TssE [Faucicola atlantae]|uniref:type VI secretion system baseplate subunit TssE n=1 Tax=Faucicola atlantae TaxID=34059 RepID=UPI0025B21AC4|nr:type VI secretion system baseplate subunit TssE [Moraxella atlantae]